MRNLTLLDFWIGCLRASRIETNVRDILRLGLYQVFLLKTPEHAAVHETLQRLNAIEGHRFVGEDCTAFVERAFGARRLFADSPVLRSIGVDARVGDPAMPLLRDDIGLEPAVSQKLQFDKIKDLPDPLADAESPNVQMWVHRLLPAILVGALIGWLYSSASRRSTPVSSTARRFFK